MNQALKVAKSWEGDWTALVFSGELDENSNLQQLLGDIPMKVILKTRAITRINSIGLKTWMAYFKKAKEAGVQIRYIDVSPVITNHLHTIVPYGGGGKVESVVGPFHCEKCSHQFEVTITTPDIGAIKPQITGKTCPMCKGPAKFDEIPQEYFQFLMI